jgi:hypothetical protein
MTIEYRTCLYCGKEWRTGTMGAAQPRLADRRHRRSDRGRLARLS